MSFAQTGFRQLTRLFSTLSVTSVRTTNIGFLQTATRPQQLNSIRSSSTYDPYQQLEDPPEPFRHRGKDRIGNPYKIYQGGPLPRPEGEYAEKKVINTGIDPRKRDSWTRRKALFGQNDYIDILGDGSVHPGELMSGPAWLRQFKGNELQRLIRRLRMTGRYFSEKEPEKYHEMNKNMWYLYKKYNHRRRTSFWSGRNPGGRNRIFNLRRTR